MKRLGGLNPNHRRVLSSTRAHLEQLLGKLEQALLDEDGGHFVQDLPPAHRQHLLSQMKELRRALDRALMRLGLPPPRAETRSSWVARSALLAAEIDLEECAPLYLRNYGPLPPAEAEEVEAVLASLTEDLQTLRTAVALFGRVSGGKLSLLEVVLGTRVLPIGM